MNSSVQIGVLTTESRRIVADATLAEFDENAGGDQFADKTIFGTFTSGVGIADRYTWRRLQWEGPNGGGNDFRTMVGHLDPTRDALLFEDDVSPCVNGLLAMAAIPVPEDCAFLSYYDFGQDGVLVSGTEPGIYKHRADWWHGAQALRLPAWLIRKIQADEFEAPPSGQDLWLGKISHVLGLAIGQTCPSYVQHEGEDSAYAPGSRLEGTRTRTVRFPGIDWDALGDQPPGTLDIIKRGEKRPAITWCEFHGVNHADALVCPRFRR